MGYDDFDWDGDPSQHTAPCPACGAELECVRDWAVHVEGTTPSNVWIDIDDDEKYHLPDDVVVIDDRHDYKCKHDHGDTCCVPT